MNLFFTIIIELEKEILYNFTKAYIEDTLVYTIYLSMMSVLILSKKKNI